jgi:hypothetical protein
VLLLVPAHRACDVEPAQERREEVAVRRLDPLAQTGERLVVCVLAHQ